MNQSQEQTLSRCSKMTVRKGQRWSQKVTESSMETQALEVEKQTFVAFLSLNSLKFSQIKYS